MDMITKTRRRFMSLMMLVTAAIASAALVAVYWLTYNSQEASNRQRLNSFEEIRITENGTVSFGEDSADAYVIERTSLDIGSSFSMLVNNQGQLISTFATEENQTREQALFQTAADIAWLGENYSKVELEGRMWQYCVSPAVASITTDDEQQLERSGETYHIRFVDITESRQTLWTLALTLSVIGALLLTFFFFFSLFFSRRAIEPLTEVMEKQRQFVADASHELKTPVSIIKANCSALYANEESTIASQREWLDSIVTGSDRMTNLIQGLIALAKIEGTDNEIMKSEISLGKEMDKSLDMLDLMIQNKALTVEISHHADTIWSDIDRVRQVVGIVLDNAIKYSNDGGMIRISITQEKKWSCLSVFNTGDGIAKEDLEKIFNRFYRAEGARIPDGSYGLGLSIAQAVMRQLGGTITADSVLGESATFLLRFPKKQSK
jgi:two-component system, OmpR family, sensor histidine kinase CiaH